ncbi:MAG TPA: MFS transporter [Bryobacteraceae bacterium]|nr:MFS transporter [Bryobacteraceae bacterium]
MRNGSETDSASANSSAAWAPLFSPLFRTLWLASAVSNVGTWMQNVGGAWLMTILSTSPLLIALVQTATTLPVFLLSIPAGALADLVDRRKLLIFTQTWMLVAAAVLGMLTLFGKTGPWTLLLLTFALGIGATMNGPAWQAIVPELVPREQLASAIALNSVGFNIARAVGPALGGLVIAVSNTGADFLLNALSFVGVVVVLYQWKRGRREPGMNGGSVVSAIWTGIRYVRFAPELHAVLLRVGAFALCASALWALLPVMASQHLGSGAGGYGLLLGCLGTGSVLGAGILAPLRLRLSVDQLVAGGIVLFAIASCGLAVLTSFPLVAFAMLLGGIAWMTVMSNFNVSAQTALPHWVRARALSVYLLVFQGDMAVGSWVWGEVAARFTPRVALLAASAGLLIGFLALLRYKLHAIDSLDLTPSMHWPEPEIVAKFDPAEGPVLVMVEYKIEPSTAPDFTRAVHALGQIRRRDGAIRWGLFADPAHPGRYIESFLVESWGEHLRQHERVTVSDRIVEERAQSFHIGEHPPAVTHWIAARNGE